MVNIQKIGFFVCILFLNYALNAAEPNDKFNIADPGYVITFPKDHGAHKNFRIEWWYFTANLKSESGKNLGVQWTLFKSNVVSNADKKPGRLNGFWMAHSAITTENDHYYEERFAREDNLQAGVKINPFKAWIDNWSVTGDPSLKDIQLEASALDFLVSLKFSTNANPTLQGESGFSKKSEQGAASHYYSQPFYSVKGSVMLNGERHLVEGVGWLDREWSSSLLSENQDGWDWFSLHLDNGDKVMLFRVREDSGDHFLSGTWIRKNGTKRLLEANNIRFVEKGYSNVKGKKIPTKWVISLIDLDKSIIITADAINTKAWMDTSFPYWEGPIQLGGDLTGVGYLEMTGY
jgi:predicted secreted hydrolase